MCEKINDFGQKIGGARKDLYAETIEFAEKFSASASVDALNKTKSLGELVKLPNLEKLANAGAITPDQACAVLTIWRSIERRPSAYYRVNTWAKKTAPKLAKIASILTGADVDDETRMTAEFRVLEAAEWPTEPFSFGKYSVEYYSCCLWANAKPTDPMRVISGRYYVTEKSTDLAYICAEIGRLVAIDNKKRADGPALAASHNRAGRWYVHPDGKKEICIRVLPEGIDQSEVRRILREDRESLLASYSELKNVPDLRRDWNRPRVGQDWRGGKDVTPDIFSQALPFRGVEFGNWVNQTERAALLNSAFDGFHDLAQILGINNQAVALSGILAFAFASRGHSNAAAHYEPSKKVINLTKRSGAGCMAHEWFHAVDHSVAGFRGYASESCGDPNVAVVGRALYNAIKNTEFFKRSANLAELKGEYWVKPRELAARGFESVVAYLLQRAGICSDFLVNCLTMDEFTKADNLHRSDYYPYPTEFEAATLAPYYLDLLRLAFGPDSCKLDDATLADIENHKAIAERQKREAQEHREAMANAEREARAAIAAKDKEASRVLVEEKAKAIANEIGNGWFHVFFNCDKAYAIGCNDEFVFLVYSNTKVAFRIITENIRIKKDFRTAHGCYIEIRKGVNIREALTKAATDGFCLANQTFYDLFRLSATSTFEYFCEHYSKPLADEREKRRKAAEIASKGEKVEKPNRGRNEAIDSPKSPKNGNAASNEAPHESLSLKTMDNGVYVDGSSRATYYNRREIKAHGATWNKESQRWEATTPEAIAQLQEWFSMTA